MKKKIGILFLLLLMVFTVPVSAKTRKGLYADNSINVKDDLDSTSFFAGNIVNVASKIDGLAFIAGNTVTIQSKQDYLFAAGNLVTLTGVEAKDAFVAGSSIAISESTFRDLYAAAETIEVNSNVDRDAYLGGETITINSVINGDLYVACSQLNIGEDAKVLGTLTYPEDAKLVIAESAEITEKESYKSTTGVEIDTEKAIGAIIIAEILHFIRTLISIILVGLLALLLFRRFFKNIEEEEKNANSVLAKFGLGFGVLCLLPIVAIMVLITVIGLPIGVISLIVYGILIYLSPIPTSYFLGKWILKDSVKNDYLVYLISITALYILFRIPFIGGISKFLSLCIGLGIFATLLYKSIKKQKEEK